MTVHQSIDVGVIPDLDVTNKLVLDKLVAPKSGLFVNEKAMRADARKLASVIGVNVRGLFSVRQKTSKLRFFAVNDGIRLAKIHRIWRSGGDFTTICRGIR